MFSAVVETVLWSPQIHGSRMQQQHHLYSENADHTPYFFNFGNRKSLRVISRDYKVGVSHANPPKTALYAEMCGTKHCYVSSTYIHVLSTAIMSYTALDVQF